MNKVFCAICGSGNRYEIPTLIVYDWNPEETEIKKYIGIECVCCNAKIPIEELNQNNQV